MKLSSRNLNVVSLLIVIGALAAGCTEYDLSRPPGHEEADAAEEDPAADEEASTDDQPSDDTSEPAEDESPPPPPPPEDEEEDNWPDWWPDEWPEDTGSEEPTVAWEFDLPVDEDLPTATADIYVNDSSNLYSYNVSAHTVHWIGAFTERTSGASCTWMVDIAIDLAGHMYGTCGSELVQIDPTNGEFVHALNMDQEYVGLTFVADGRLILAGNGEVRVWNPANNQVSVLNDGTDYVTSGDLVGLPDGNLYWTVTGGDDLVRLDASTGNTTWIGATSSSYQYAIWGVAWADGALYGFTSEGQVVQINSSNASATVRAEHSASFYGAAANPVSW